MTTQTSPYQHDLEALLHIGEQRNMASPKSRVLAWLIDFLVLQVGFTLFALALAAAGLTASGAAPEHASTRPPWLNASFNIGAIALATLLMHMLINAYWLHRRGQTLGKMALRIQVVHLNGTRASLVNQFFLRSLPLACLVAVPYLGIIAVLLDVASLFWRGHRCLHDRMAGTRVVQC